LIRYIARFTISNLILTIGLAALAVILKIDYGSSLAIGATLVASMFAASGFSRDHARAPTDEERKSFAWRALLNAWAVSLLLTTAFLVLLGELGSALAILRTMKLSVVLIVGAGAIVFMSAIYYIAIRWSFGWYANLVASKQT
jgi:hypothetical protein